MVTYFYVSVYESDRNMYCEKLQNQFRIQYHDLKVFVQKEVVYNQEILLPIDFIKMT